MTLIGLFEKEGKTVRHLEDMSVASSGFHPAMLDKLGTRSGSATCWKRIQRGASAYVYGQPKDDELIAFSIIFRSPRQPSP